MKADILDIGGKATGRSVELSESVFNVEGNEHAVYLAVKAYQSAQQQGTHSAKERNAVTGSTRKIKKQKGTGTARAGDIKNPIFRGGGRIFGPRPRTYRKRVNKKVSRLARTSVLSDRFSNGHILVLEDFSFDAPKTKAFKDMLLALKLQNEKILFVSGENERSVFLSARNLPNVNARTVDSINIFDLMQAHKILFTESAAEKLNTLLS
jgi:large subunit ribosomal protein L4